MTRYIPFALRRYARDQSGAVAVEFVLIAPLLFTLLFGIMILGYFMGVSHSVQQLATGAARASVAGLDTTERAALADSYLSQSSARYPLLSRDATTPAVNMGTSDPADITVTVTYAIDGSVLGLANALLGIGISDIKGSAYLAY